MDTKTTKWAQATTCPDTIHPEHYGLLVYVRHAVGSRNVKTTCIRSIHLGFDRGHDIRMSVWRKFRNATHGFLSNGGDAPRLVPQDS